MINRTIKYFINYLWIILPAIPTIGSTTNLTGDWCENGGPYTCYPPIDSKTSTYICTNSTKVTSASDNSIVLETQQTVHYYSHGIMNGKSKSQLIKEVFKRTPNATNTEYEHTETIRDKKQTRKLIVNGDSLQVRYKRKSSKSNKSSQSAILSKINYQRCSDDPKKKAFYTALVDCGGSGDYITGVPAVVNNPLLWDLGDNSVANKSNCQIAARCWGGGWVAYAQSEQDNDSNKAAFGAACGTKNRHDAKKQAINSCRESGGTNCLQNVVSGYDSGTNALDDTDHKGAEVESCSYGQCSIVSAK